MKFKCNLSGCEYNFESALDIRSMRQNSNYSEVVDKPPPPPSTAPATVAPVKPLAFAPDKPLPAAKEPAKAV